MRKINFKTILFTAFLAIAFMFSAIQESFAAEKFTLSVQNRYAEDGIYYADVYASVPDGVTWKAASQTIVLSYNTNAIELDDLDGVSLINLNSSFNGYVNTQTQWSPGEIALNLAVFFPPFAEFSNEEFRIATLRWNVVDGTLMDELTFLGNSSQCLDEYTELSYNADCDSETCFKVEQPTSQQVALPVPLLDSPADLAMGQALNVTLEWNAVNHDAVDTYDVLVATDVNFNDIILDINTSATNTILSGLDNGTTYFWKVRSSDDDLGITSDWSLPWEFKTMLATPTLASPADGTLGTETTLTLSWDEVTGADGYIIYVESILGIVVQQYVVAPDTEYEVENLDNYNTYTWYVEAYESDGMGGTYMSDASVEWEFRTMVDTPVISTPTDGTNGLNTNITFEWAEVLGADSYNVEIMHNGSLLESANVAVPMFSYNLFENCSEYSWRVQAVDEDDYAGEFSDYASFETKPSAPVLSSPADAMKNVPLNVTLEWDAVDCADTYDVTIMWGEGNSYTEEDIAGTTFNYGLYDYYTDYSWYVVAYDQYGNPSEDSDTWEFRTTIDAPVLTTPADDANGLGITVDFVWTEVDGADTYSFELWHEGSLIQEITSNTNMITWGGLEYCSEYEWKVKAVDVDGYEGEFSDTYSFETKPSAPVLTSVSNGEVNVPLDATLEWEVVDCAATYDVTIMWGEGNSYTEEDIAGTTFDYTGYEYLTDYSWYVVAYDMYGNPSEESAEWTFQTIIEKPEVPVLVSPADLATEVVLTGDVEWEAALRAETYDIEIATDMTFDNIVHQESDVDGLTSSYVGLDNDSDHWWRVRANNVGGISDWSDVFEFKTMLLAPPMIIYPTNNMENALLEETIVWDDAQGAVSYNLQLSDASDYSNLLYDEEGLSGNDFDVELEYGTTYYLRMQSIDEVDNLSNWGEIVFYTVAAPSFTGPEDACELSVEIYQAPDLEDATYTWTVTGGTYTVIDYRTIEVEFGSAGMANVWLDREFGTLNDDTEKDVELQELNYATVDINAYHTYDDPCVNEAIDFDADITDGEVHTYMWDFGDESSIVYEATPSHVFPGAGTYTVTLEVEGDNCTVGSTTFDITIADDCPITITTKDFTDDDAVCKGDKPVMDVALFGGDGNYTFEWTPSNEFFDSAIMNAQVKNAVIDRNYQLKVEDGNGLFAYGYADVEIADVPSVSLPSTWLPFPSVGSSINLNSKISNFDSDLTYIWTKGSEHAPVYDPENETVVAGRTFYYVYAQDSEGGCPSLTKRIMVYGLSSKQIPTDDIALSSDGSAFAYSYPNPVKDVLTLEADFAEVVNAQISVHTLAGQKLMEFSVNGENTFATQLDLTGYSAGMYIIIIDTDSDMIVLRVIKE